MAANPSWDAPDIGHSCKIGIQLKSISADVAAWSGCLLSIIITLANKDQNTGGGCLVLYLKSPIMNGHHVSSPNRNFGSTLKHTPMAYYGLIPPYQATITTNRNCSCSSRHHECDCPTASMDMAVLMVLWLWIKTLVFSFSNVFTS
jgi:hypothetical protein